jgi:hypothetical protein
MRKKSAEHPEAGEWKMAINIWYLTRCAIKFLNEELDSLNKISK